jgi:hypothetical protein
MRKLSPIALMILLLFPINGHVADGAGAPAPDAVAPVEQHLDPHVSYYQQHLIRLGIK